MPRDGKEGDIVWCDVDPAYVFHVANAFDLPDGRVALDGWMIGVVVDAAADTTDLVILDAQTFARPLVARVQLPHRVPPEFYGNWIASRTTK